MSLLLCKEEKEKEYLNLIKYYLRTEEISVISFQNISLTGSTILLRNINSYEK